MAEITTRLGRNAALSYSDVDNNFLALNAELALVHGSTFIQVPSVLGLPAQTADGSLVEVADTTGIQLSGLVTGAPVGFTGSGQFTARLRFTQSTPTNGVPAPGRWQWIDYSAKDPNSRYSVASVEGQIATLAAQVAILEERVLASSAVGDVKFTTLAANPPGWIEANGALLSRNVYAELFEVFGTRYGAGNGTTTFRIPDYRGVVLRGLDNGRGLDPSRAQGSLQEDQNKRQVITPVVTQPVVTQPVVTQPTVTQPTVNQPTVSGPTITHNLTVSYNNNSGGGASSNVSDLAGSGQTQSVSGTITAGAVTLSEITLTEISLSPITLSPITLSSVGVANIEVSGGDEARVKNVAERAIIKAFSRATIAVVAPADIRLLLHLNGNLNDSSQYQDTLYNDGLGAPLPSFVNSPVFFPGQSARLNGTYAAWDLGAPLTGEFCIDLRLLITNGANGVNRTVLSLGYVIIEIPQNGQIRVFRAAPSVPEADIMVTSVSTMPIGQFAHLAWTRSASGVQRLYVDGSQVASSSSQTAGLPIEQYFRLGSVFSDSSAQELRLLYRDPYSGQSFTPPTQRYPNP